MSRKPSKPETRIEDYLDVMTGGNAALPQPILRIEFYYAFLAGMAVELPQPILDDEKLLAKICGMEVEAPTYIPGISPRLYAYMAKKGGQDVQVPDPILRLECYWYDYSAGSPPSVQEYTGAVPVTFIADGTPLIDYLISGNEEHSGTPTPDSPIIPQGTGERTGNLFDYKTAYASCINADGDVAATTLGTIHNSLADFVGQTITIRVYCKTITATRTYITSKIGGAQKLSNSIYQGNTGYMALTVTPETADDYWTVSYGSLGTGNNIYSDFMLNTGSTPLPYEPYGYKIQISSASTTTPVYLGEVETTRKIKKLVLTGEESYNLQSINSYGIANFYFYLGTRVQTAICSHLKKQTTIISQTTDEGYIISLPAQSGQNATFYMRISSSTASTVAEFKAWLAAQYAAGTPVTVWYVLATAETAVANEPLMKIGDYADTLSYAQAGVSIPTANGSTTLTVETTVKPSEVYIKYRGEAVATLSALSAEVSSPEETPEEGNPEEMEEEENEC